MNTIDFPVCGSHHRTLAFFSFSAHNFLAPNVAKCLASPLGPCSPSDARLVLIAHQKPCPFPILGLLGATLASYAVSMGLGQRTLTEVLVVLHQLAWPLVQGVFDTILDFFRDLINLIQSWFLIVFLWIQFGSQPPY